MEEGDSMAATPLVVSQRYEPGAAVVGTSAAWPRPTSLLHAQFTCPVECPLYPCLLSGKNIPLEAGCACQPPLAVTVSVDGRAPDLSWIWSPHRAACQAPSKQHLWGIQHTRPITGRQGWHPNTETPGVSGSPRCPGETVPVPG